MVYVERRDCGILDRLGTRKEPVQTCAIRSALAGLCGHWPQRATLGQAIAAEVTWAPEPLAFCVGPELSLPMYVSEIHYQQPSVQTITVGTLGKPRIGRSGLGQRPAWVLPACRF